MSELDYSTIPAPSRQCMVCGVDLAQVDKHPSVLEVNERGAPTRRDVCPGCWEKMADKEFFSFWVTHREPPKPDTRGTRERQREALMQLFQQIVAADDPRFRNQLYVLGHLLMRHRLLKWEGTESTESGKTVVLFRNPATDETIRVEEIEMDEASMIAVKRQIDATLDPNSAT